MRVRARWGRPLSLPPPTPSAEDHAVTRALQTACVAVGLKFIDHLVVTDDDHRSIASMGGPF